MKNKIKRKILVTGISKGIGKAICKSLIKEGYVVYGTYNTGVEEALALQDEFGNLKIFQVDFSERESTKSFLQQIEHEKFYAIINNAGMIEFENWDNFSMDLWDKTMEVNVNTPMLIVHTLRNNIEDNGSIVNISSTDGMKGTFSSIAYSASKAALLNITQSLTNVFGYKKVRVNSIAPGWVGDGMDSPAIRDAKWINPLGRTAQYEEIANAVSFLISKEASYINGTNLVIDGGSNCVDYVLKREFEAISNPSN